MEKISTLFFGILTIVNICIFFFTPYFFAIRNTLRYDFPILYQVFIYILLLIFILTGLYKSNCHFHKHFHIKKYISFFNNKLLLFISISSFHLVIFSIFNIKHTILDNISIGYLEWWDFVLIINLIGIASFFIFIYCLFVWISLSKTKRIKYISILIFSFILLMGIFFSTLKFWIYNNNLEYSNITDLNFPNFYSAEYLKKCGFKYDNNMFECTYTISKYDKYSIKINDEVFTDSLTLSLQGLHGNEPCYFFYKVIFENETKNRFYKSFGIDSTESIDFGNNLIGERSFYKKDDENLILKYTIYSKSDSWYKWYILYFSRLVHIFTDQNQRNII